MCSFTDLAQVQGLLSRFVALAFRFRARAPPNGRPTVRPIATPPRPEGAWCSASEDASDLFGGDFFCGFFFVAM
jgi:hypothetical protein